jgi:hypothetical protein
MGLKYDSIGQPAWDASIIIYSMIQVKKLGDSPTPTTVRHSIKLKSGWRLGLGPIEVASL